MPEHRFARQMLAENSGIERAQMEMLASAVLLGLLGHLRRRFSEDAKLN